MNSRHVLASIGTLFLGLLHGCGAAADANGTTRVDPDSAAAVTIAGETLPNYGAFVDNGVQIESPVPGTTVRAGQPMRVAVKALDGFRPARMLIGCRLGSVLIETAPFVGTLEIPPTANGDLRIGVMAFDSDWNMAGTEITVRVEHGATLASIRVDPDPVFLIMGRLESFRLHVLGMYSDGVERQITRAEFGTTYESLDRQVVTVDREGRLSAIAPGETKIRARNVAHTAAVDVFVQIDPASYNGR